MVFPKAQKEDTDKKAIIIALTMQNQKILFVVIAVVIIDYKT